MNLSWKDNVSFILVEPQEPRNIWAAARALQNMGFRNLELVNHEKVISLNEKIASTLKLLEYIPRGDRDLEKKIMKNLKHLIGRSGLTEWELNMICGICARIEKKLRKSG
jgi:tRNA C32,U32 (ribose-2'-O)-methylase TrmJ